MAEGRVLRLGKEYLSELSGEGATKRPRGGESGKFMKESLISDGKRVTGWRVHEGEGGRWGQVRTECCWYLSSEWTYGSPRGGGAGVLAMLQGTREKGGVEKAAVNTDDTRRLCLLSSTGRGARS